MTSVAKQSITDLEITKDLVIKDEKVLLKYQDTVLCSSNNMSIIHGPKGSMKSTVRDLLIQNLLKPSENFNSNLTGNIVVIDTEMSKRLIKKNLDRYNDDRVRVFSIKGTRIEDMRLMTEKILEELKPEILIIDGSRDYVVNSNDPTESMKMVNQLMYWMVQYKLHIVNIVHSVKTVDGEQKTKGTFGSELSNKAESIISMARYYDKAKVSCSFSRESQPFKAFKITLNENNQPIIVKGGKNGS
ncbi:MAG: hypothetical protein MPJ25_08940 [Pirellulales bacterium]|nr:hypothetical protein [Pirellulales bacterium]